MEEITWDDVKKGQFLLITQDVEPKGPRRKYHIEWCGEVVEHSPKWTILKYQKESLTVPTKWGREVIKKMTLKEFKEYMQAEK